MFLIRNLNVEWIKRRENPINVCVCDLTSTKHQLLWLNWNSFWSDSVGRFFQTPTTHWCSVDGAFCLFLILRHIWWCWDHGSVGVIPSLSWLFGFLRTADGTDRQKLWVWGSSEMSHWWQCVSKVWPLATTLRTRSHWLPPGSMAVQHGFNFEGYGIFSFIFSTRR